MPAFVTGMAAVGFFVGWANSVMDCCVSRDALRASLRGNKKKMDIYSRIT